MEVALIKAVELVTKNVRIGQRRRTKMNLLSLISKHWAETGVIYLLVLKFLTIIQDAVDAEPKDLKPPFGKAIYYLTAISGYLFAGNRPQAIGGSK